MKPDRFVAARDSAGRWAVKDTVRGTVTTAWGRDRARVEAAAKRKSEWYRGWDRR